MSGNDKQQTQILSPREPLTDGQGNVTRSWWRFFNGLYGIAGSLANPLTVTPNALLNAATLTTGGTISSPELPPQTLIGNASAVEALPAVVPIGASLSTVGGSLNVAPIARGTLAGNPKTAAAAPTAVSVGTGLTLSGDVLSATPNTSGDDALTLAMVTRSSGSSAAAASASRIYAPLVNGGTPGPYAIADPHGQFIMVPIT